MKLTRFLVANDDSYRRDPGGQVDSARKNVQNSKIPPLDLTENITGMYRLLDLISESGSNGCGNDFFLRCAAKTHELSSCFCS